MKLSYARQYGFDVAHVVTTHLNIDEYSAFAALSRALQDPESGLQFPDDALFLMLHDTCEAGRLFWDLLATRFYGIIHDINDRDNLLRMEDDHAFGMFIVTDEDRTVRHIVPVTGGGIAIYFRQFMLNMQDGTLRTMIRYHDGEASQELSGMLSCDCTFTTDIKQAVVVPLPKDGEGLDAADANAIVNAAIHQQCQRYMWWPISENFNLGIATKEFVLRAGAAYAALDYFSKEEGISMEVDLDNPLNLKNLATVDGIPRWRYVFKKETSPRECKFPTMSLWLNDTNVYGNGKLRNIAYLHTIDMKKYSCLVGKFWNDKHESGR